MSTDTVDLSKTIAAKADQLNADDLISGPMTAKVVGVREGNAQQPVLLDMDCWKQPYKPCKTARRIIVDVWGKFPADIVGKSFTLYRNPAVKFEGVAVGGIEISHMSGLDKPREIVLATTRGKKRAFTILPLHIGTSKTAAVQQPSELAKLKSAWWATVKATIDPTESATAFARFVIGATGAEIGDADIRNEAAFTPDIVARCYAALKRAAEPVISGTPNTLAAFRTRLAGCANLDAKIELCDEAAKCLPRDEYEVLLTEARG